MACTVALLSPAWHLRPSHAGLFLAPGTPYSAPSPPTLHATRPTHPSYRTLLPPSHVPRCPTTHILDSASARTHMLDSFTPSSL